MAGCDTVDVDPLVFRALMKNSLVYDGRLVVDAGFCTTDPHVFAAGPLAKFSRKYGRTLAQEEYDSAELGRKLADALLRVIDPATAGAGAGAEDKQAQAPLAPPTLGVAPRVHEALLPGGYHYLFAAKPSLREIKKVSNQSCPARVCQPLLIVLLVRRAAQGAGDQRGRAPVPPRVR